jgi:hypothetical protein
VRLWVIPGDFFGAMPYFITIKFDNNFIAVHC